MDINEVKLALAGAVETTSHSDLRERFVTKYPPAATVEPAFKKLKTSSSSSSSSSCATASNIHDDDEDVTYVGSTSNIDVDVNYVGPPSYINDNDEYVNYKGDNDDDIENDGLFEDWRDIE